MDVTSITRAICSFALVCFLAGCESDQKTVPTQSTTEEQVPGAAQVNNDCQLPAGVVFTDCVSSMWRLPSYYYMPTDGAPGREVFAGEPIDHFVQARISEEGPEGNRVVDVVYGDEPANALFRFRVSENQPYPADMRDFRAGALEFDLRVLDWGNASSIGVRVECGWPCTSETIDLDVGKIGQWQSYRVSAQELVAKGLDLSKLDSATNFVPSWDQMQGIHFQIDNLRWVKGEQNAELPYRPKKDWAALALKDLEFIYETALENHPGAIDAENPEFREYLDSGYKTAKAMAAQATSRANYKTALSVYMAGFADGHFMVSFNEHAPYVLWPGFNVQKQGPDYRVSHRQESDWQTERPEPGDILISCDGRTAAELMEEDVLFYHFRDNSLEAKKWTYAERLFAIGEIGDHEPYKHCVFSSKGNNQLYDLHWQPVNRALAYRGQHRQPYHQVSKIQNLGKDLYWVYLPSFLELRGPQITAIEEVIEKLKGLPKDSTVVFDMRFNNGGNAGWALKLLAALHGQSMIKKLYFDAMHDANAYGEFRVSQGNYEFHREKSKDKTMAADSRAYMDSRYKGIKAAYDEGKQWYREGDAGWLALAWFKLTHLLVSVEPKQNTVLLTSPRCASACLNFADAALLIPDAVHMGQETSADTNYLDVRWPPIALPSQQGSFVLPMKVWRNRPRGHNEPHVPEHIYDGNITDTQTIQAWVVNTLNLDKADL